MLYNKVNHNFNIYLNLTIFFTVEPFLKKRYKEEFFFKILLFYCKEKKVLKTLDSKKNR